jgi:hypothetical protein
MMAKAKRGRSVPVNKAAEKKAHSNGLGIAGFIVSLVGLLSSFKAPLLGLILGIVGLVLCIIQLKKGKNGLAIAGLVIGIIAIIFSIIIILALAYLFFGAVGNL